MFKLEPKGLEKSLKEATMKAFQENAKKIIASTSCPEHHEKAKGTFSSNGELKLKSCCEKLNQTIAAKLSN